MENMKIIFLTPSIIYVFFKDGKDGIIIYQQNNLNEF